MKLTRHLAACTGAAACTVLSLLAAPAFAATCKDVTFGLYIRANEDVEVTKVRYKDLNSGDPNALRVEDVPKTYCESDLPCPLVPQDLGSRRNHVLDHFQVYHRHKLSTGGWGNWIWSQVTLLPNGICTNGRGYAAIWVN